MRRLILLVVVLLIITTVASADEVKLVESANPWAVGGIYKPDCPMPKDMQELRVFDPGKMSIDSTKATMLAKRLFVSQLIGCSSPVWTALPYPSVVIQTYSMQQKGDAFVRVDRAHGVWRPGWTWWSDSEMTMGAHMEQCTPGRNLVFSLFVAEKVAYKYRYITVEGPERVVEVFKRIVEPIYIGEPVATRQFIAPNVGAWSYAAATPIGVAMTTPGQWFSWLSFAVYQVPGIRMPGTPDSPYCPSGGQPNPDPGDTTPPNTAPPLGDGDGWSGPLQPPDAPPPAS